MPKEKSAFDLSDDDFEKVMSGESDEFIFSAADEPAADEPAADEPAADEPAADEPAADEPAADEPAADELSFEGLFDEPAADEPAADEPAADKEEKFEIIHKGQIVKVTKDEAINLAQQGYDYLEKTTRIAPHRKLLDLIDADPDLQQMINKYVTSKTAPEVTKREDYESEEAWLQDNIHNAVANAQPVINPTQQTPGDNTGQPGEAPIVTALRNRDPQNFNTVGPVLKQVIERLTVSQYNEITQSPEKVVQFYDKVKEQVLSGGFNSPGVTPRQNQNAPRKKTFNLRSGQGSQSRTPAKKNVWDLGNKEFDAVLRKVKGY